MFVFLHCYWFIYNLCTFHWHKDRKRCITLFFLSLAIKSQHYFPGRDQFISHGPNSALNGLSAADIIFIYSECFNWFLTKINFPKARKVYHVNTIHWYHHKAHIKNKSLFYKIWLKFMTLKRMRDDHPPLPNLRYFWRYFSPTHHQPPP